MEHTLPQQQTVGGFAGWILAAIQRHRSRRRAETHTPVALRTLETLSLGGRRRIAVIECDGQRFLVGLSADAVTAIAPAHGTEAGSRPAQKHPHFQGGF